MKNLRWVIQTNLGHGDDHLQMQEACKKLGVEFQGIEVIPFSITLPSFKEDEKTNIYYGSTTFMYNLYNLRNKPVGLFFDEEKFSMENYIKVWGEHMLNSEAKITTFDEFSTENHDPESLWFIRPDADDKSFAGDVMTFEQIKNWTATFQKFDNVNLSGDKKIIVGPPYNIKKEWRNYIVDGKIVASSLYRKDFRLNKSRHDVPSEMLDFVQARINEYMPHKNFAMDIAFCGDSYYIIECGCLNSVGFYDADISVIVEAITNQMANEALIL